MNKTVLSICFVVLGFASFGCRESARTQRGRTDAGPVTTTDTGPGGGGGENTALLCSDGMDNDADTRIDCEDFDCTGLGECPGRDAGPPAMACEGAETSENTAETCTDECSNDGDAFADCEERDCCNGAMPALTSSDCGAETYCGRREDTDERCTDGTDNDGNGAIDCMDFACQGRGTCVENTEELCSDGISNDGDGFADCEERDCCTIRTDCAEGTYCGDHPAVVACEVVGADENTEELCTDGCDNNGNGYSDCGDRDCCDALAGAGCGATTYCGRPTKDTEKECRNGTDDDADTYIDCEDRDCCDVRDDCATGTYCGDM